ncbi:BEM_HP_G0080760.mRNA.1.CDS.1 [Saccharomyces cerevisiae]|nr:BEM_HP_G0080760.mRNA.1.CDS.1 [Saccharomyces cerevisiae]CAI6992455.1 BEM_HP_G0080760.mRNA.1.CDS.1 [Saccharomyces cerevisiae]
MCGSRLLKEESALAIADVVSKTPAANLEAICRHVTGPINSTFVKSLSDASNETLRLRMPKALGALIEHQPHY